jgi:hypothetical protein
MFIYFKIFNHASSFERYEDFFVKRMFIYFLTEQVPQVGLNQDMRRFYQILKHRTEHTLFYLWDWYKFSISVRGRKHISVRGTKTIYPFLLFLLNLIIRCYTILILLLIKKSGCWQLCR